MVYPSHGSGKFSLKELRRRLGMSQRAFAEALGVPQSKISRWEAGAQDRVMFTISQFKNLLCLLEQAGWSFEDLDVEEYGRES